MLFLSIFTSLDGYIEDADGGIEWMGGGPAFDAYVMDMLGGIEGIILGRKAHDLLAQYWPTATLAETGMMNTLPKYVLTRGGRCADWSNSHPVDVEGVRALKARAGGDIALFAGAETVQVMLAAGLVDQVRLIVNPVTLGGGKRLFADGDRRTLKLEEVRRLGADLALITYTPTAS